MATTGLDGRMKMWDVRTYKQLQDYSTYTPASSLSISQRGLLAVGYGPHIEVRMINIYLLLLWVTLIVTLIIIIIIVIIILESCYFV